MSESTFYSDGYRDAMDGKKASPPNIQIYAAEYMDGYAAGKRIKEWTGKR